jgi:hypothetical protein
MIPPTQAEAARIEWLQFMADIRSELKRIEALKDGLKSAKNQAMAQGMIAAIKHGANQWI